MQIFQTGVTTTTSGSSQVVAIPRCQNSLSPQWVRATTDTVCYMKFGQGQPISTTVTVGGTNNAYTAVATVSFAAPAVPGRTATGHALMKVATVSSVAAGGSGYAQNDVLTVVGGTGTAATITVSTVSSGAVTAVSVTTAGQYSALPSNPVSVTGGGGTLCTLNLTWSVDSIVVDDQGLGYGAVPTVTVSGNATGTAALAATIFAATANDIMVTSHPSLFHTGGNSYFACIQGTSAAKLNIMPVEGR